MGVIKGVKVLESEENYLEAILVLSLNNKRVRSIDIVNEMEYSKPSVSIAMKNLLNKSYILKDKDGNISLTAKGQKIADTVYERHVVISDWLMLLGVDRKTALHDACHIEHALSEKSFVAIKKHIEKYKQDSLENMENDIYNKNKKTGVKNG